MRLWRIWQSGTLAFRLFMRLRLDRENQRAVDEGIMKAIIQSPSAEDLEIEVIDPPPLKLRIPTADYGFLEVIHDGRIIPEFPVLVFYFTEIRDGKAIYR